MRRLDHRRPRALALVAGLAVAATGAVAPLAAAADDGPTDLARLGTVTASAFQDDGDGTFPASNAIDGDDSTRWASGNGPDDANATYTATLTSDLGAPATVDGIALKWEASYATAYDVETALGNPDDPDSWSTAYSTTTGDGGTDAITFDAPAHARYVRIDMKQRAASTWEAPTLHYYGYSVYTLSVAGAFDTPQVSVGARTLSVGAGKDVTIPVTLSNPASTDQTVHVATTDGTAKAGSDYEAVAQDLTFKAGETQQSVVVHTTSAGALAGNRTFTVALSKPSDGLALADAASTTVTLTPTGTLPDAGSSTLLEGFEQGVPSTYAVWGSDAGATPALATVADASVPGATDGNHALTATVAAAGTYGGFTYEHRIDNASETFDWSAYDGFSFWFLGQGSGTTFSVELHNRDANDKELGFATNVTDDSTGWRKVSVLFKDLKPKSGVSAKAFAPATSTGFAVTLTGLGAGTFTFDGFSLDQRAVLLDDFEHGVSGDATATTGYFAWGSADAQVTLAATGLARGDVADNHVLGGQYLVPDGGYGGFSDNLAAAQDWSSFRGIRFWWYASQANNPASPTAGADIQVELKDGGPDAEHAESWVATFKDNWSADGSRWKLVSLPFSAFQLGANQPGSDATKNGTLDLTSSWGYSFTFPAGTTAATPYSLDDVELYGTPAVQAATTITTDQDAYLVDAGGTAHVEVGLTTADGKPLAKATTVDWSTGGGTAKDGTDYTAASGTLTFDAGTESGTTQTVDVATTAGTPAGEALTIPVTLKSAGATAPAEAPRVVVNAHGLPYLDATLPTAQRVDELLGRMTLQEKVGQMAQAERLGLATPQQITTLGLGSVLSGGGSTPAANTPQAWADMIDGYQREALATPLQVPLLYGADAVHGHSNVKDATIYPHNIGLGATRSPALVEKVGEETASETRTTGVNWAFAPCLCVARDERWGRTYESFGEDPALVSSFSKASIEGLQGSDPADKSGADEVLASAKHWAGDGGTTYDDAVAGTGGYPIDQGITNVPSQDVFEKLYATPYVPAIQAGVGSIMPSYSALSIDGADPVRMTEEPLNQSLLKDRMGFDGFLISDYQAIDKLSGGTYAQKAVRAVTTGSMDMAMAPYNFGDFITAIVDGVNAGQVPQARVDDAVRRILTQKFELGLFEHPFTDDSQRDQFGGTAHRATAAQAAAESQVLLKNTGGALPLKKTGKLYVAGSNADDLGNQTGGWTITWQGQSGTHTTGTTILDGIEAAAPDLSVTYSKTASADPSGYDAGLVVVGETPYAEGQGDVGNNGHTLDLTAADQKAVDTVCAAIPTCVVLVVSGRPMMLGDVQDEAGAIVAGFLPGSEGEGVASVLLGDTPFTGRLPLSWPKSVDQLPLNVGDASYDPAWAYGWGLRTDAPRARLTALVGSLSGEPRKAVQALLDAKVWASDGTLSDTDAGLRLVAVAAKTLTQATKAQVDAYGIDEAQQHPIDPAVLAQADTVVSLARDLAQRTVVGQGTTPDAAAVTATADAEHLQEAGDAYDAVVALAKVAGVDVTTPPLKAAPKALLPPLAVGLPVVGLPLVATPGLWSVPGVKLTYQWNADGTPIRGATGMLYRPVAGDVGKRLTVTVTASKAGYHDGTATSPATGKVVKLGR